MTIHTAGTPIKASEIFEEIGKNSGVRSFNANATALRELCDVAAGPVKFSDFYGKCAFKSWLDKVTLSYGFFPTTTDAYIYARSSQTTGEAFGGDWDVSSAGSTPTFDGDYFTALAKGTLRDVAAREIKMRLVSSVGFGASTTGISKADNGVVVDSYVDNTWINTAAGPDLMWFAEGITIPGTVVVEVGVRWAGISSSQVLKTFTLSRP